MKPHCSIVAIMPAPIRTPPPPRKSIYKSENVTFRVRKNIIHHCRYQLGLVYPKIGMKISDPIIGIIPAGTGSACCCVYGAEDPRLSPVVRWSDKTGVVRWSDKMGVVRRSDKTGVVWRSDKTGVVRSPVVG